MSAGASFGGPRIEADPWFTSSPYEPQRPPARSLQEIDLLDQDLYRIGDPHAAWRLLRAQAPVFWHERGSPGTENKGFWVLSRYDDVGAIYRNSETYSSWEGPFLDFAVDTTPTRILASLDGEAHRTSRSIVTKYFTPGALRKWAAPIGATVDKLLDSVAESGECDFYADIASQIPANVSCDMLGINKEESDALARLLHAADPNSPASLKAFNDRVLEFFNGLAEERRAAGARETVIDVVANARADGFNVSEADISHLMWILFFGGIDSTVHAATGGLLSLFHHPEQLDLLRKDPNLVAAGAIEEMLRWTSTSHANKRKVLGDVEIHGTKIRKGDYVSMWSPSANRDETAFENPYRFEVRRKMKRNIQTFGGGGLHQCLGQYLARLELQILFERLFRRFPDIEQNGSAVRRRNFTILVSPIVSLPVKFTPSARAAPGP